MQEKHTRTDVLVIGGAGAGLRAAIAAAEKGCAVTLLCKGKAGGRSNTALMAGWITRANAAATDELFHELVYAGGFLNDQRLVEVFCSEVPKRIPDLTNYGVDLFSEDIDTRPNKPGQYQVRVIPKETRGHGLVHPMRLAAESLGVQILDDVAALDLLTADGQVVGATALDQSTGDLLVVSAKATILATGGGAGAYARHDNAKGTTGDGFALAYRAGAELINMECISLNLPGAKLQELLESGQPDPSLLSVGGCHYFLGGVRVDVRGQSTLPGLYAAGEVTGGLFGAARLGGSAIADTIVFGAIAGESAAADADTWVEPDASQISETKTWLQRCAANGKRSPGKLTRTIRETFWEHVGTMKTEGSLLAAEAKFAELRAEFDYAQDTSALSAAVEVRNMLDLGLMIVDASLMRTETRGCYWRLDHPQPDNAHWLKNIVQHQQKGKISHHIEDVVMTKLTNPGEPPIGPGCFWYSS